jgi:hypothetical protein
VKALALVVGLLIAAIGLVGVVAPPVLQAISNTFMSPSGLVAAAVIRIALGTVLMFAAAGSRLPGFLRGLGLFAVLAGIVTLFLGDQRAHEIQRWWLNQGPIFIRLFPALALVLGVLIVFTLIPAKRAA